MKLNKSYLFAGFAVLAITAWFWINSNNENTSSQNATQTTAETRTETPTVIVESRRASLHQNQLALYGRTEANRYVEVKAKTAGIVSHTPRTEGQKVNKGDILCKQNIDARQALVDQAKANLKSVEFDQKSTQILVDKGYRSEIQLTNIAARIDAAIAGVKQAEIELDNVNMYAPFSGIFDSQIAEVGDFLSPGQACGSILEMHPLIVTTELTEKQVGEVKRGQTANIKLITGQTVSGKIRFIESSADAATRTFRTEIAVSNKDYALKGGVTADIVIPTGVILAQNVPSKILTLNNQGTVGIRYIDDYDTVQFAATQTIDEDETGIWVTGLPETTRIIVQGQDYVSVGTKVDARLNNFNTASR